jgi:serine protease AprX
MNRTEKIYPIFAQKIKNDIKEKFLNVLEIKDISNEDQEYNVLISFKDEKKRDNFISKYKQFNILKIFDIIPSILLNLTKNQILNLQNEESINRIEEDQKLYLSMRDLNEIIGLNDYKRNQIPYSGNNIIIGIIDNGINPNFDTISDTIIKKYIQTGQHTVNIDEVSHGTLMANVIGNQFFDNNKRTIGIAPNAKLIDFDISNFKEEYYFSNILEVFDFILKGDIRLDILLISLTTLEPSDGIDLLSLACNLLTDKNIIIICPAGNFGPESYTIGSPSAAEKVITIGATTKKMTIAYYSGRGPTLDERIKPDLCLPGSKIEIPLSNELIIKFSGTSISAAVGAGLIALLKQKNLNLKSKDIIKIIQKTKINLNYENISQGFGTINIMNIFEQLGYDHDEIEQEIIPYNYLIRRSLKLSIEIGLVLIIIYLITYYFNLIYIIYNMFKVN